MTVTPDSDDKRQWRDSAARLLALLVEDVVLTQECNVH